MSSLAQVMAALGSLKAVNLSETSKISTSLSSSRTVIPRMFAALARPIKSTRRYATISFSLASHSLRCRWMYTLPHHQPRRLPAIPLRSKTVRPVPAAQPLHGQRQPYQSGHPACVGGEPRDHRRPSPGAGRQAHLQTQKGDRGAQLRRRQTTARTPLRTDARSRQSPGTMPAGRRRAEPQENRPAAHCNRPRYAAGNPIYAVGRLYRSTPTQLRRGRYSQSTNLTPEQNPTENDGVRQQSEKTARKRSFRKHSC